MNQTDQCLVRLRSLYGKFDDALAVVDSCSPSLNQQEFGAIYHQHEKLREMRDKLLPLDWGPAPQASAGKLVRLEAPELTDLVLDGLGLTNEPQFQALCARLGELEIERFTGAQIISTEAARALESAGATPMQIANICYTFEASAALSRILSEIKNQP